MNFERNPQSALLTSNLCEAFEKEHSLNLPADYRYFLCNTLNGGRLSCKKTSIPLGKDDATPINNLLGIGAYNNLNIEEKMRMLGEEDLPTSMLPIANDPGGNFFFLATLGSNSGKVYFFDHEVEPNHPPTEDNNPSLTLIAYSFTEFLESIECIED